MIWSSAAEIWMKTTWFGFSTALQTFIQRYFSMQMLTLHCDLYEWRRVRSAHTKLLLDISGDLRRCVGSQISAIASIFPIELTRSTGDSGPKIDKNLLEPNRPKVLSGKFEENCLSRIFPELCRATRKIWLNFVDGKTAVYSNNQLRQKTSFSGKETVCCSQPSRN